jgi:hypothetical protein
MWMNSDLLPHLSKNADDICWMRSLHTEAINHEPAICAMQTGNQIGGRPCLGFLGFLWPRLDELQFADLCRIDRYTNESRTGAGYLFPPVVERLSTR